MNTSEACWNRIDEDIEAPFSEPPDRSIRYPHQVILSWRLFKRYEQLINEKGVDVVLSGMGGDQVLYGGTCDPVFLADDIRQLRIHHLVKELRKWVNSPTINRSIRYLLSEYALRPLKNYCRRYRIAERQFQRSYCPWMSEAFMQRAGLANRIVPAVNPQAGSVLTQYFLEDLQVLSFSSEQHWNQLINSFEMRFPLLYRPLFMCSIPLDYKMQPGENRVLQRRSLVGILPERVRCRRDKRGPDQAFFDGLSRNKKVVELLTKRPQIAERGYVDLSAWREVVQNATLGNIPRFSAFFASVTLELWLQQSEWREVSGVIVESEGIHRVWPESVF